MKCKILFWFCALILIGCEEKKQGRKEISPSLTKTILVSSKGGKKTWRLTSERIKMKGEETHLYDVKFELFKDEKKVCTVRGERGKIAHELISLFGNVTLSTEEGATLTTNSINFTSKSNSLYTDDEISFIKGGFVLKGNGFIANRDLSEITIKKNVEVFFRNK